jgi:cytochrome c-type biogenesis protein CcmH/NrfF
MRWSSQIHAGLLGSGVTRVSVRGTRRFRYGAFTLFGPPFQAVLLHVVHPIALIPQPRYRITAISVWALPVSLAATQGVVVTFLSSGYLDVSVPPVPSTRPMCSGGSTSP